jgi:DNA mismatch repair protein MutL
VEREQGRAQLRGYFSRPDAHRSSAAGLYLFVNGRPVRDRLLRHAVMDAYRDVLPRGRFPTALLFLGVPPEALDVNVHPAKWEVRFSDPREVHRLVADAARAAFASRGWLGATAPAASAPLRRPVPAAGAPPASDWILASRPEPLPAATPELPPAEESPIRFGDLRLVGQLLGTYLVVEQKDGLLLVDQHAAHERVLYERLRAGWLERGVERQPLLAPEVVALPAGAAAALARESELAEALGFEIEGFDEGSVAVRAIPALLSGRDPAGLVRGLADELRAAREVDAPSRASPRLLETADRILATLACHSARTAGEVLDPREQRALLGALDGIPWAPTCPHGRPVAVALSLPEIERRFGRR